MADAPRHLLIVPHTHWDREWYRTHEQFRARLVRLLDGLLERLEGDPAFRHFTLDGQTIVVDDYLEVRPGARERLAKLVRDGRLLVGPWSVLPDEWLVSGEALIRNLRLGLRRAAELGGGMPIGYVPDQFGHVGQLPQIFAGFGFPGAVVWRGVGEDVDRCAFQWEAPDGTRLFTIYLVHGYGNAAQLPLAPEALADRLRQAAERLAPFAAGPTLLLMNGSDHQEPQPGLPAALEAALPRLPGWSAEIGTLPGYLARARAEARGPLPVHRGELRSGLRAPLLPGCASARAPQKRREFHNDRLLTRYLEPLAAWLAACGGDADPGLIEFAWRVALENHPHDSICGCSVDRVHEQMETRFRRVEEIAGAHLARVGAELARRVAAPRAGFGRGAGECLVVWNPNAAGPALADGVVELEPPSGRGRLGPLHLRDARGRRLPVHAEPVEPARRLFALRLPKAFAPLLLDSLGEEYAGHGVCGLRHEVREGCLHARVLVAEAPRGDPAAERRALEALLARDDVEALDLEVWRAPRLRLRFADDWPGHGLRVYRLARGRAAPRAGGALAGGRLPGGGAFAENLTWRAEADGEGRVQLLHRPSGTQIGDALRLVSEGDRGDAYNFDPLPDDPPVERPERVRVSPTPRSEACVGLRLDARYRIPRGLSPDRRRRVGRGVALPARLSLWLFQGVDRIDLEVELANTARDHRLRLHLRAPFAARRFAVESAFEVAPRPIAPRPDDFGAARPAERPIGAGPQRSVAVVDDGQLALSVANRGVAEVEAVPEEDGSTSLALTLLRAVGWLSRDDLRLRPGHAGPPLPTPGAQVPGPQRAELCLRLHPADAADCVARAHAFAAPPLPLAGGGSPRAPLRDGDRLVEVDDPAVVVSAIEPRAEGLPVLRVYNASAQPRRARVRWGPPGARGLERLDLAERPLGSLPAGADGAPLLALRPWEIVTLRPR